MLDPLSPDKAKVDAWRAARSFDMECLSLSDDEVLAIIKKEEQEAFAARRFEAMFGRTSAESARTVRREPYPAERKRLEEWERFFNEFFKFKADFKNLRLPDSKPGLDFLIAVPKDLTLQRIAQVLRVFIPVESAVDLSKIRSARRELGDYATYASRETEVNNIFKGISAKTIIGSGITPMNLEERLLMDSYLCWKTRAFILDVEGNTLCAGSIDANKNVIRVDRDDKLIIAPCPYGTEDDDAAIREVVG